MAHRVLSACWLRSKLATQPTHLGIGSSSVASARRRVGTTPGAEVAAVELGVLTGTVLAPPAEHVHGGGVEVDATARDRELAERLVETGSRHGGSRLRSPGGIDELTESLPAELRDAGVQRRERGLAGGCPKLSEGGGEATELVGVEPGLPVGRGQVLFEHADETPGDRVRVLGEGFPLIEHDVEGHAEPRQCGTGVDEAAVRHTKLAVLRRTHETKPERTLHEVGGHRAVGELGEELERLDLEGVRFSEECVELGLDADDFLETATVLPLIKELANPGERVAVVLEAGDEPQPTEVRLAVPASPAFEPWWGEQTLGWIRFLWTGTRTAPCRAAEDSGWHGFRLCCSVAAMTVTQSQHADALERVGTALADPTRRRILLALLDRPYYPADLAEELALGRTNISNHLSCLRGCGLVRAEREGRQVRYELSSLRLARALADLVDLEVEVEAHRGDLDGRD